MDSAPSVSSALDFDPLPNDGDKNANQVLSSGTRSRGLFDAARHCPYWGVARGGVRPLESSSKPGLGGEHQIETAGTLYWWYG